MHAPTDISPCVPVVQGPTAHGVCLLLHSEGVELDMRVFRWRLFWCIAPVVVALIVTSVAAWNYKQAQQAKAASQGLAIKLGVDLVGGTILVYEVDVSKF